MWVLPGGPSSVLKFSRLKSDGVGGTRPATTGRRQERCTFEAFLGFVRVDRGGDERDIGCRCWAGRRTSAAPVEPAGVGCGGDDLVLRGPLASLMSLAGTDCGRSDRLLRAERPRTSIQERCPPYDDDPPPIRIQQLTLTSRSTLHVKVITDNHAKQSDGGRRRAGYLISRARSASPGNSGTPVMGVPRCVRR